MDMKELRRLRCEQTMDALLDKIDKVLDDARDDGHMSCEDVKCLKDCWKTLWYSKQCCKEM